MESRHIMQSPDLSVCAGQLEWVTLGCLVLTCAHHASPFPPVGQEVEHPPLCDLLGPGKAPILLPFPPITLPLSPKPFLRIITFIMNLIMRDFFVFKNKCWLTGLYLVYGSRLHINVLKGQQLWLRWRRSPG